GDLGAMVSMLLRSATSRAPHDVVACSNVVDPGGGGAEALAAVAAEPQSLTVSVVAPLVLSRILSDRVVVAADQIVGPAGETDAGAERERPALPAQPPMRLARSSGRVARDDVPARAVMRVRRAVDAAAAALRESVAAIARAPAPLARALQRADRLLDAQAHSAAVGYRRPEAADGPLDLGLDCERQPIVAAAAVVVGADGRAGPGRCVAGERKA